jgi:hypothetical protein
MRWSRLLTGVLLTLLVREILAPARATAECGDYVTVTHPSRPSGHSSRHAPPARAVRATPFPDPAPDGPVLPGNVPCHGPSCSADPGLPTPPVSSGQGGSEDHWDCLVTLPASHAAATFGLPLQERRAKPFRLPSSIFHPPRPC